MRKRRLSQLLNYLRNTGVYFIHALHEFFSSALHRLNFLTVVILVWVPGNINKYSTQLYSAVLRNTTTCVNICGYTTADSDGEAVEQWADLNRLSLIHNAKLPKSFNSVIWKKGYYPALIFVSSNISDMCEKSVLDPIPRTQHRPICVTVHPVIVPQPTPFRRRFNLRKAKWDDFSTDFDEAIEEVEPIPENYDRFIGLIRVVSRRHIPRGCRTNYIPGLTEESQCLYEAYKKQYTATLLPKEPWKLETS